MILPMRASETFINDDDRDKDRVDGMINNWVDVALNGGELIAPGYEGINSLILSNAMYLSAWKDCRVDLPFDEDEFFDILQDKIKNSTFKKEVKEQIMSTDGSFHK